ncbi:MAG: hypothetical protein ACR2OB_09755 [Solirubrobacteraceae bacterium]
MAQLAQDAPTGEEPGIGELLKLARRLDVCLLDLLKLRLEGLLLGALAMHRLLDEFASLALGGGFTLRTLGQQPVRLELVA